MGDDGRLADEQQAPEAALEEATVDLDEIAGGGEALPAAAPGGERAEVERLERELAQVRDQWLRTLADLDNFRKRSEREQREMRRYALFEPLRDLLPVVDNLERALAADGPVEDLKRGVELIQQQLRDFLRNQGVQEIAAQGAPFDPSRHDAVSRFEDPGVTSATVAEELQRGYCLAERLLRPALVRVAMPASRPAAEEPAAAEPPTGSGEGDAAADAAAGNAGGQGRAS
jgi:molecular chaperone GrpE